MAPAIMFVRIEFDVKNPQNCATRSLDLDIASQDCSKQSIQSVATSHAGGVCKVNMYKGRGACLREAAGRDNVEGL